VRINKYLGDAGVCSRREADGYVTKGKVAIDGVVAELGSKVAKGQTVTFDGKEVVPDIKLRLIAFNKPRGIVCTTDKREPNNIIDFLQYGSMIYPIGRLDRDSEGLILLTNNGDMVNKILREANNHEKEYIVTVNKVITQDFLSGMAQGVPILDVVTKPCTVEAIDKTTFRIILTQGLNRQIRRMCEYFGYGVLGIRRIRIMNISLGHMHVGDYRNVTEKELETLKESLDDGGAARPRRNATKKEQKPSNNANNKSMSYRKVDGREQKSNRNTDSGRYGLYKRERKEYMEKDNKFVQEKDGKLPNDKKSHKVKSKPTTPKNFNSKGMSNGGKKTAYQRVGRNSK